VDWNKTAFTLVELLVVIVLIGVIALVATPNVREFINNREYKNDVYKISAIINSLRSNLESKKADVNTGLPLEIGSVLLGTDANGVRVITGLADSERLQRLRANICNANSAADTNVWNVVNTYSSSQNGTVASTANETFINLSIAPGGNWACFTIKMDNNLAYFDEYSGGVRGICHKSKIVGTSINERNQNCSPSANNVPYYGISVNKFGRATVHRYDYATSRWREEQN